MTYSLLAAIGESSVSPTNPERSHAILVNAIRHTSKHALKMPPNELQSDVNGHALGLHDDTCG